MCQWKHLAQIHTSKQSSKSTAMTEFNLITIVIGTKQEKDAIDTDIPNALVQIKIENKSAREKIIMKLRGQLDML